MHAYVIRASFVKSIITSKVALLNCTMLNMYTELVLTHSLTYSMVHSPSWEANWFAASQEIPRTPRFITALTSVHHLSLSWTSPIQSIYPHPTSWRPILISTHLRLGLPCGLFPSGFPTKTLYTPSPRPYAPYAQLISFFSILSPAQYWVRSTDHLAPRNAIHSPVTSTLLGPNILLNNMFWNNTNFIRIGQVNGNSLLWKQGGVDMTTHLGVVLRPSCIPEN